MCSDSKIVVFMDLLGFSSLVETNHIEAAMDNLQSIHYKVKQKIIDNKTDPVDSYKEDTQKFAEDRYITSFNNLIQISDSLIVSAKISEADLFLRQLCYFVASIYFDTTELFKRNFRSLNIGKKTT